MKGLERQTAIYLGGIAGRTPTVPPDATKLEERARRSMPHRAWAYVAAGAGTEDTLRENRAAFERWRIVPRMLRDVSKRDLSIELFGRRLPTPFVLAPVGVLELAHRDADLAVARAARTEGVPMVFSNQASTPMERIAGELGDSPRWFQLYWSADNDLMGSLVSRAERCGCEAIVLTVDTTMPGWRARDLDVAYLPFLRGKGIAQYTSDSVFQRLLDRAGGSDTPVPRPTLALLRTLIELTRAYPGGFLEGLRSGRPRTAVQQFTQVYSRPSLNWDDLPQLRERTKLPILLKGILHPDDAARAVDAGMDGIVVSNHGGRQVDGSIATLDALPAVADAVAGRVPIVIDSGIRSGADAFKALALGATAVSFGRPYVYGLAIDGEDGVRAVLQNFIADFDLTMALSGYGSVGDIERDALARV
ncbi:MAG: lactate 2-monooxygenase [Thermoleophilaceae bacterium]|nr:lactate 2-monooxygenase [Thermoleophilaceae bacterium]